MGHKVALQGYTSPRACVGPQPQVQDGCSIHAGLTHAPRTFEVRQEFQGARYLLRSFTVEGSRSLRSRPSDRLPTDRLRVISISWRAVAQLLMHYLLNGTETTW